ncbi:MAG: carbonate dehydratase [Gammaproteobacteria bacterium]|nr:carbonate dehydratase [Gammaproteobacteria bacterium]
MDKELRLIEAHHTRELEQIRQFFRNYAAAIGVDLCFQNFDQEMAGLPGAYAAPEGRLYLALIDDTPAGCVGVRRIADGVCEMKRLYVDPAMRGRGLGRDLATAAIRSARELGYRRMQLDTLPAMRIAVKLYRELGFSDSPAYYPSPLEGTLFLSLDLQQWSEGTVRGDQQLLHLFDYNRAWADQMREVDAKFFEKLAHLQTPEYLWIGCSDSRVPANQIVGLLPGEVFVHRNVANVVAHTDLNCLSVLQYAVDVLGVKHIMVVGHYGCGGVGAALQGIRSGLVDIWLRHVQDVKAKHQALLERVPVQHRHDRLCELNVLEQVAHLCHTMVVQDAWARGQALTVHGWIYGLGDGLMHDIGLTVSSSEQLSSRYQEALELLG